MITSMFKLLSVTNRVLCPEPLPERIRALARSGVDGIILREKDLPPEEYRVLAEEALSLCRAGGVTCILHSFPEIAEELGADALHLPLPLLRALSPERRARFSVLGASCHSQEDVQEAAKLGCTYVTLGHIFATDCKKGLPPRGLGLLEAVCAQSPVPVYAIGGIGPQNLQDVRRAGASGACIMSGLMTCPHPEQAVNALKEEENSMKTIREALLLYAVTDRSWTGEKTLMEQVEQALRGGATCIQLREKHLSRAEFLAEAVEMRELCHRYGVPLLINDDVELAKEADADGVHVGPNDMDPAQARAILGPDKIIGVSARTVERAKAAEAAGASYLGSGAVFGTSTKLDAMPLDHAILRDICRSVSIPVVAIGGITRENLPKLTGTGVAGAALVSTIFSAPDIEEQCRELSALSRTMVEGGKEE